MDTTKNMIQDHIRIKKLLNKCLLDTRPFAVRIIDLFNPKKNFNK